MTYTVTVTSKRQITLPAKLFVELGIEKGQKLQIRQQGRELVMSLELDELHELMGSVKRPKKFAELGVDEMIAQAKNEYWSRGR